jgi:RHS repeat-associated protein
VRWTRYLQTRGGSQLASLTQANSVYVWQNQPATNLDYTFNGLNQDAAIAALPGYDAAGNLIASGVRNYQYDARNRMINANTGASGLTVGYDALGRLRATSNGSVFTYFLNVGDNPIGEYADNVATTLPLRRYVFADGVDEPIVWYEGADASQPRWLHADRQGSIIATSDLGGAVTPYTYSPYGEPGNGWSGVRFRYTGQVALPEIQAYYYKARIYDPALGRFLQTDPIGLQDDPNLYAYVKGDPINARDPTGLALEDENTGSRTGGKASPVQSEAGPGVANASKASPQRINSPAKGPPGTTVTIPGRKDGEATDRTYGSDGRAQTDVDRGHDHGEGDPHAHDWDWSKDPPRQPGRPLTPEEREKENARNQDKPKPSERADQAKTAAAGVTVGVIIYWIVSEGSRLFLPRNLIPIP